MSAMASSALLQASRVLGAPVSGSAADNEHALLEVVALIEETARQASRASVDGQGGGLAEARWAPERVEARMQLSVHCALCALHIIGDMVPDCANPIVPSRRPFTPPCQVAWLSDSSFKRNHTGHEPPHAAWLHPRRRPGPRSCM